MHTVMWVHYLEAICISFKKRCISDFTCQVVAENSSKIFHFQEMHPAPDYIAAARKKGEQMSQTDKAPAFRFLCSKQWRELDKTPEDNVRFCQQCKKPVFLARDAQELSDLARQERCAAIQRTYDPDHKVRYPEDTVTMIGDPAPTPYRPSPESQAQKGGIFARLWWNVRKLFIN